MKVYLSKINESWIIDRVRAEWYQYKGAISTDSIDEADIIWIISPWLWKKEKKKALRNKHVVCSIYHFEDNDFKNSGLRNFKKRDKYVDTYHVISKKTLKELGQLTNKKIVYIPFWVNQNIWFPIEDRESLRSKYKIPNNSYVVGSFQRDTEAKYTIYKKINNLRKNGDWNIKSGIMFNHESEFRNEEYLFIKIINSAKSIKDNKSDILELGSLELVRDWSFAGDVASAIYLINNSDYLENFVIGSGTGVTIAYVVETIFNYYNLEYNSFVKVNESLLRSGDPSKIISDPKSLINKLIEFSSKFKQ